MEPNPGECIRCRRAEPVALRLATLGAAAFDMRGAVWVRPIATYALCFDCASSLLEFLRVQDAPASRDGLYTRSGD